MKFKKWLEKYEESFAESVLNHAEKYGFKKDGDTILIPKGLDEQSLQLFIAYRNEKTTKHLIFATWILAIATIILSGLTLYFQYFKM